jgi:hypothetical protein
MAQLTPLQYRQILQIAADACGGSPAARARIEQLMNELTEGEWDHRRFFIRLANLLGPLPDTIPVFQVVGWQEIPIDNLRYKDAIALICARLMIRNIGRIPDPNVLVPLMSMFRPGLWNLVNIDRIGFQKVNGAEEELPEPEVPLPEIKIPEKQTDIITDDPILDGTRMVDFHGERARHRYYKESTYKSLKKPEKKPYKENPFDRKAILPGDVTRYIAKLDSTMPVQEAGRRKCKMITMRRKDYLREHHHLFKVLSRPTKKKLLKELMAQQKELKERGLKGGKTRRRHK